MKLSKLISKFLKKKKNHNNNHNNNYDARTAACIHDLPLDLVKKILDQRTMKYSIFGDEECPYKREEYNLMMLGAMIAYHSQELLGTKLPPDDPKCMEITKLLIKLGVRIQFHPDHGMRIVEDETVKEYRL